MGAGAEDFFDAGFDDGLPVLGVQAFAGDDEYLGEAGDDAAFQKSFGEGGDFGFGEDSGFVEVECDLGFRLAGVFVALVGRVFWHR